MTAWALNSLNSNTHIFAWGCCQSPKKPSRYLLFEWTFHGTSGNWIRLSDNVTARSTTPFNVSSSHFLLRMSVCYSISAIERLPIIGLASDNRQADVPAITRTGTDQIMRIQRIARCLVRISTTWTEFAYQKRPSKWQGLLDAHVVLFSGVNSALKERETDVPNEPIHNNGRLAILISCAHYGSRKASGSVIVEVWSGAIWHWKITGKDLIFAKLWLI